MLFKEIEEKETSCNDLTGSVYLGLNLEYEQDSNKPNNLFNYFEKIGIDMKKYTPIKVEICNKGSFCGGNGITPLDKIPITIFAIDIKEAESYGNIKEIPVKEYIGFASLKDFISIIDEFSLNLYINEEKYRNNKKERYSYPIIETEEIHLE